MTHDELLEKIKEYSAVMGDASRRPFYEAMLTVAELHKPIKRNDHKNDINAPGFCLACTPPSLNFYEILPSPCPTLQAIEKALA